MTYLSSFMILNNDNVLLNEECYIRKNNDWVLNEIIDKDKFIEENEMVMDGNVGGNSEQ
ncbi:hypothetical protein RhiirC2_792461 [Rhizophagus irregularis]|uniref:Uncharacterized protein n=1 Tax=Rhizophagus irregularis TaxID=588596 RepID=A0A2N1MH77_9GLOM|nr:hypothetical protein RhiirC2_792461 [Rhizophagus irregularis]